MAKLEERDIERLKKSGTTVLEAAGLCVML